MEAKCRNNLLGNVDFVKVEQRLEHGGTQCTGTAEPHQPRNVRAIADRKISPRQLNLVVAAILDKHFCRRFQKPDAAIVSIQRNVLQQSVHAREGRVIDVTRLKLDLRAFPEVYLGFEVLEGERNGLAEVAVGRITD